ncbi:MAG: hypothetical protein LBH42_08925 [Treponema sp.]|jgi:hypothetical protein|nr:hypothetical protein [Treponema sp.]
MNKQKAFTILALIMAVLLIFACGKGLPRTSGEFQLTDASEYNGKYAILVGMPVDAVNVLYGFKEGVYPDALKGVRIQNGQAKFPLYKADIESSKPELVAYSGNDTIMSVVILLMDTELFDSSAFSASNMMGMLSYDGFLMYMNVKFSGGKATMKATERFGW